MRSITTTRSSCSPRSPSSPLRQSSLPSDDRAAAPTLGARTHKRYSGRHERQHRIAPERSRSLPAFPEFSAKAPRAVARRVHVDVRAVARRPGDVLARDTQDLVFRTPWTDVRGVEAPAREVVRRRDAQRHRELPRSAPHDGDAQQGRHRLGGRARRRPHAHLLELHREVVRLADALRELGVETGDRVAIYMGMVPEIGRRDARVRAHRRDAHRDLRRLRADALRDRINDCQAQGRSSRRTAAGAAATSSRSRRWPTTALAQTHDASRRSSCSSTSATSAAPSR